MSEKWKFVGKWKFFVAPAEKARWNKLMAKLKRKQAKS